MTPETLARKALVAWQAEDPKARSQSAIAKALGFSQPTVGDWIKRNSRPKREHRHGLERLTDGRVAASDWMTARERAAEAKLASVAPLRRTG